MFAADRIKRIKDIMYEYKHVDINTLSVMLGCSVATVRRDLERLESEGFLKKAYGGAILSDTAEIPAMHSDGADEHLKEKFQIALIAAEMVENNDIIFLGPGSTCLQIAKCLKEKDNLTLVTNNLNIVMELAGVTNIRLILLGGDINGQNNCVFSIGEYAVNSLKDMFINKAFFTVDCVSIQFGYMLNNREQAMIMKEVMRRSAQTIIAADSSKFGKRAFVKVMDITEGKKIITDINLSSEYKEFLFNNEVELFTTFENI